MLVQIILSLSVYQKVIFALRSFDYMHYLQSISVVNNKIEHNQDRHVRQKQVFDVHNNAVRKDKNPEQQLICRLNAVETHFELVFSV